MNECEEGKVICAQHSFLVVSKRSQREPESMQPREVAEEKKIRIRNIERVVKKSINIETISLLLGGSSIGWLKSHRVSTTAVQRQDSLDK